MTVTQATGRQHFAFGAMALGVLVWSGVQPHDRFVWMLEVAPAPIAAAILAVAYPRWRLTPLVLGLVAAHAVILMVGGKYTYAHVPWFDLVRDAFGGTRNQYDRLGHFAQGFVPALVAREILLRREVLARGAWLFFLVTCTVLAISAFYELIEWWVALASGQAAEEFLGTQGDPWDTQSDMFMALIGAVTAQLALGRWHDRLLGLRGPGPRGPGPQPVS